MIGQLTVKISANDPTTKCETLRAFVGSPSNVRIVGVPSSLGNWKIQTVYFTVNYPDNRSVGKTCKAGVGVYVATVEGSALPGKSLLGYTVKADGVDENGEPVIGYVLGKGDVEIVDADATLTPGETTHYIHVLASRPENPHSGDAYVENGTWRFYNGTAWTVLGGVSAGNSYVMAPVDKGGDGLWHRMIIVDGTIAFEREGVAEPPLAADKQWVVTQIGDAISVEESRAKAAERENAAAIEAEAERAKAAEGENAAAITAEEARAKAAEQANATAIAAEAERAKAAEGENAAAIEAEHARASGAESTLSTALTKEIARAGAAEESAVHKVGAETVNGVKTFSASPLVPTVDSADDDSMKSASTGWVVKKLAAWWATVKSALTKSDVGLGNVDNTSDANKPVSTATQAALNAKANDDDVVKIEGEQTIKGLKRFTYGGGVISLEDDVNDPKVNPQSDILTQRILFKSKNDRVGEMRRYVDSNGVTSLGLVCRKWNALEERYVEAEVGSRVDANGKFVVFTNASFCNGQAWFNSIAPILRSDSGSIDLTTGNEMPFSGYKRTRSYVPPQNGYILAAVENHNVDIRRIRIGQQGLIAVQNWSSTLNETYLQVRKGLGCSIDIGCDSDSVYYSCVFLPCVAEA